VHDFAADNSFRYYQRLGGKTPRPLKYFQTSKFHISGTLQHNQVFSHPQKPVISKILTTFFGNTIFLNDETLLAKHPFILKSAKDQRSTALSPFLYSCGFLSVRARNPS
jgi:hypothetical protein